MFQVSNRVNVQIIILSERGVNVFKKEKVQKKGGLNFDLQAAYIVEMLTNSASSLVDQEVDQLKRLVVVVLFFY